ncbi:MAG: hypothetical protein LBO09_09370 [Candidatus Peribacteria bacterium]|nr:hypothetical protein [Candidatus Peribacteria bacterium]
MKRRKEEDIPAQYNSSSYDGKLHFFLVGQENRGLDKPYINVCIKDKDIPREIKIEEGKVYKISILEFKESEEAKNNTRKQSYSIN